MSGSRSRRSFLQATTAAAAGAAAVRYGSPQDLSGGGAFVVPADRAASRSRLRPGRRASDCSLERSASGAWVARRRAASRRRRSANAWPCAWRATSRCGACTCAGRWPVPPGSAPARRPLGARLRRPRVARRRRPSGRCPGTSSPTTAARTHGYGVRTGGERAGPLAGGRRGRQPLARRPLRRARRRAGRPHARGGDRRGARGPRRRVGLRRRAGPSAPSCTTGRACRPRPSTAATAGTAPTTASTPTSCVAMTEDVVALSPAGENRPYAVIDSGWQASIGIHAAAGGPWREPNRLFPPDGEAVGGDPLDGAHAPASGCARS